MPASARSPVHALNPPGPRLTHVCASPPAELSDEQLKEWHAQAVRVAQWLAAETARRAALQTEQPSPPLQLRCVMSDNER